MTVSSVIVFCHISRALVYRKINNRRYGMSVFDISDFIYQKPACIST